MSYLAALNGVAFDTAEWGMNREPAARQKSVDGAAFIRAESKEHLLLVHLRQPAVPLEQITDP